MSKESEIHLLKARLMELESTVDQIDRGQVKHEMKLRERIFADLVVKFAEYQPHDDAASAEYRNNIICSANVWADAAVRSLKKGGA